jgi:hypothetical protein
VTAESDLHNDLPDEENVSLVTITRAARNLL